VGRDLFRRRIAERGPQAVDARVVGSRDEQDDAEADAGHRARLASSMNPPGTPVGHHGGMQIDDYRIRPGDPVDLGDWPAGDTDGFDGNKADALARIDEQSARLFDLQQVLYADNRRKVLIVLQGMDTSGKDGTIKHVFKMVNPLGVKVANFKRPNDVELDHDYLWRVHRNAPGNGEISIFNRSHYEDVLVVRVHDLVSTEVWRKRYDHIRHFEQMLADEGTVIRKFFLHISRDEQRERLEERLANPAKHWKFEHGDIEERAHWKAYTEAYEEAISRTSTEDAPWYVVPSNKKWYRNLLVSTILVETLESLDLRYPEPKTDLDGIIIEP
jgi:PPK2 family polyphosphate:nucleotide phosphotransferase